MKLIIINTIALEMAKKLSIIKYLTQISLITDIHSLITIFPVNCKLYFAIIYVTIDLVM